MKAMICRRWGGPEDLKLEDVAPSALGKGQVRIRIKAAGVSFATTLVIAGKYLCRSSCRTAELQLRSFLLRECHERAWRPAVRQDS